MLGNFSEGDITGWKNKSIKGKTEYELEISGKQKVICATADATSSAFGFEYKVDITSMPNLHWSWKVMSPLPALNEKLKDEHDFAARITVIDRIGIGGIKSHIINYVYSTGQDINSTWANPFNSRSINVSVQSNKLNNSGFSEFTRNVREDFKKLFGYIPDEIDGIAIVTDADNSGAQATACYGDIWFSS